MHYWHHRPVRRGPRSSMGTNGIGALQVCAHAHVLLAAQGLVAPRGGRGLKRQPPLCVRRFLHRQ